MPAEVEAIIGLEVHIQLNTSSKAFCADRNAFGASPNTQVGAISLAHPGTLPKANQMHIRHAIKLALALGCKINPHCYFDRKHYFYADLPKGYQITQDQLPVCSGGQIEFEVNEEAKQIRIHHIHMEEDAGKSLHEGSDPTSQIDFNRAGVPLLEMVTEPDFRSAEEVFHFIYALRRIVQHLGISDGNMEEGSLRCDCNVSIRKPGDTHLNNRCEVKNVNSARFARKAIEFEINRQTALFTSGEEVVQETREFVTSEGITRPLRSKEEAYDYRYFPEPDLPPLEITTSWIEEIRAELPELPLQRKRRYQSLGITGKDADVLCESLSTSILFDQFLSRKREQDISAVSKFWINYFLPWSRNAEVVPEQEMMFDKLEGFLSLIEEGTIVSSTAYQKLWPILFDDEGRAREIATKHNLLKANSSEGLTVTVKEIFDQNPAQVEKYLKGKKNVMGFFMGQLMRSTGGKVDPAEAQRTLESELEKLR